MDTLQLRNQVQQFITVVNQIEIENASAIKSKENLERELDIPVLGVIPLVDEE